MRSMPKLKLIPRPVEGTRAVLTRGNEPHPRADTVLFRSQSGKEKPVYTCGNCDAELMIGVPLRQAHSMVLQCAACGAYNEAHAG
jgi:DNA-directed RNA polymerase subunit RPC12/RpoP